MILDLDGPLLDGKMRHYQCYSDILKANGYVPMQINNYWKMKRQQKSIKDQLAQSKAQLIYTNFITEWIKNIETPKYLAFDKLQHGALDQLRHWSDCGIEIILVTMRHCQYSLIQQLKGMQLLPYFSSVITCQHKGGGTGKAIELMNKHPYLEPLTSIWIGDTEVDLEAARYFKSHVCLLTCGLRTKSFLTNIEPDFLFNNLADIKNRWSNKTCR